jgi:hypothetical protein
MLVVLLLVLVLTKIDRYEIRLGLRYFVFLEGEEE